MSEFFEREKYCGRTKRVLTAFVALAFMYVLFFLNSYFGIFKFRNENASEMFFWSVLSIPFILIVLSFWFPKTWLKIVAVFILLPIAFYSTLFGIFAYAFSSSHKIQTIQMKYCEVSIYEYDQFYIYLEQEKEIFPGVLLVRNIYSYNNRIKIEPIDENQIKITFPPDNQAIDAENGVKIIGLKRFVYF